MSFDLYFCHENNPIPSVSELKEYFSSLPLFKIEDVATGGVQFWYENEATGVYGGFSYSPLDANELEGCGSSGLTFNLNFILPSFFAYETMPLVEAFCSHFDLVVEDPQEETVAPANAERLIASWRAHNKWATAAMAKERDIELHYLPEPRATEWWRYMKVKQEIDDAVTEDIFVPTVMVLIGPAKQPLTVVFWPDAIAQFFPACEYVCLKREKKGIFRTKEEMGLIPYQSLVETIKPLLDEYDTNGLRLKYLGPDKTSQAARAIQKINLQTFELSQHSRLSSDVYHDVAPGAGLS